jgi:hypothetical protein
MPCLHVRFMTVRIPWTVNMDLQQRSCGVRKISILFPSLLMQLGQQLHPSKLMQLMQPQTGRPLNWSCRIFARCQGTLAYRVRASNIGLPVGRQYYDPLHRTARLKRPKANKSPLIRAANAMDFQASLGVCNSAVPKSKRRARTGSQMAGRASIASQRTFIWGRTAHFGLFLSLTPS